MTDTVIDTDAPAIAVDIDVDVPAESILPEGVTIPQRDDITSRVIEHVRGGGELKDMVAADLLGLPTTIIQQARDENTFQPPRINSVYTESRNTISQPVSDGPHLTISGAGSRDIVKNALTPYFEEKGMYAIVELSAGAGHPRVIENVPEGFALVQVPNQVLFDARREAGAIPAEDGFEDISINGQAVQLAPSAFRTMFDQSASWDNVLIEGVDTPVAAVKNDGRTIIMFINPFVTNTWNGWSRSEQNIEEKAAIFHAVIDAARERLTNISVKPVTNPEYSLIRDAVKLFESIKTLGIAHMDQFDTQLDEAKSAIATQQSRIESARQQLTTALLEKAQAEERVQVFGSGRSERISEAIEQAFVSVQQLAGLRSIKYIEFRTNDNGQPLLHIETFDLAMDCKGTNGTPEANRRLIKGFKFDVTISGSNPQVTFDATGIETPSVHPHVNTNNQTICWGQASTPLAEAAGRRDWVTLVNVIIRWCASYNHASPYVARDQFPTTDHAAGWIID